MHHHFNSNVKCSFQLFGDVMNVAARMESAGLPNRIHVSEETASLLIGSGKESWVTKRSQKIHLKGKGEVQSYWLRAVANAAGSVVSKNNSTIMGDMSENSTGWFDICTESTPEARLGRLVGWNSDQLVELLKHVVARRESTSSALKKAAPVSVCKIGNEDASLLEKVKEIVELPAYVANAVKKQQDPESVFIPQQVVDEIRDYVAAVCDMYNDNAFHSFEHASAVSLSVLKLLSRIVAPSDLDHIESEAILHDHT